MVTFYNQYEKVSDRLRNRLKRMIGAAEIELWGAIYHAEDNPKSSLNHSRQVLEYILHYISSELKVSGKSLNELLQDQTIREFTPSRIHTRMEGVRILGNLGSHAEGMPTEEDAQRAATEEDAQRAAHDIMLVVDWFLSNFEEHASPSTDTDNDSSKLFSPTLRKGLRTLKKRLEIVTEEQFQVLKFLRDHRRVSICGCAGSGKTLLAMEKASRLDAAGLRTLILCHNPYLADFIREGLRYTGVRVEAFCQWIRSLTEDVSRERSWTHFDEPTSDELGLAFDRLFLSKRYDAVIVDEAQDFADEWWTVAETSLESQKSGHFYIFYDSNQALLPFRARYPITESPVSLQVNCRNSQEIAIALSHFAKHAKSDPRLIGGTFTCHQFIKGEEDRALGEAFSSILSSGIWELCVVTTDPEKPSDSILAGRIVTVPPSWRWQAAVEDLFNGLIQSRRARIVAKGEFPSLSENFSPTSEDIDKIVRFSKDISIAQNNRRLLRTMHWENRWGQLCLSGPVHSPQFVLGFFSSPRWADTLPTIRKLTLVPFDRVLGPNEVALHNASSIKGLEADAVVTIASRPSPELRAATYVALSRARLHQHLLVSLEAAECLPIRDFTICR